MAQEDRLTIPLFFGEAVNALQAQGMEGITRARNDLLLMLAAVGVAWTMHGPARIVERFTALVVREGFADALHAKALALPLRWHEQHHSGDTLHRMTRATSSLSSFAQSQFIYLQNTVSILGPIAALFLISRATGAAALAGYAAIGFFVVRIDAFMVRLVREENRAERRYNSALVDCLGNIATVLTLRLQEPIRKMLRSRLLEVFAPLRRNIVFNEVKWGGIDLLNGGMRTGLVALYAWLGFRPRGAIGVGAGKRALLRVRAGLVAPEQVSIEVDGTLHPALKHLGGASVLLSQDPAVFESTVRENVTMGLPYRQSEIERACELAGFTPVIEQLPQGFDTVISERGLNLSGGQKQRLALARGLLAAKEVGLVLLDEATSSIDASTEGEIYHRVMTAFGGACIVSSVHRLHLLKRFDTVIVMEDGRVSDSGAPEEVKQRRPELFAHSAMEAMAETRAA